MHHPLHLRSVILVGNIALGLTGAAGSTLAQPDAPAAASSDEPFPVVEKDVRRIYAQFFRRNRNEMTRQQGWEEFAAFSNDTRTFPLLIELFGSQRLEIRNELVDFFVERTGEHAQTMTAWIAVFEEADDEHRAYASAKLAELVGDGEPSYGAQLAMSAGLKSDDDRFVYAAADLIRTYNLLRAVPLLAQAQLQPRPDQPDVRTGAIAQIIVGTQQAFVADLNPVVAAGTVGFEPVLAVATEGTVLRVHDAVVYEYRTNVHRTLVAMTTAATGDATGHLGYDANAWRSWYAAVLEPMLDNPES